MLRIATIEERTNARPGGISEGFSWYYMDISNGEGSGLVFNWARGLPFLPGSRRRSGPDRPASMNIVAYSQGRQSRYLLQEWSPDDVEFDAATGNARFGAYAINIRDEQDLTTLSAHLDLALPGGERWRGDIEVSGPTFRLDEELAGGSDAHGGHLWCPQTIHARGRADLMSASERWEIEGSAYVDSNLSAVPLHQQGIARWDWGRVSFGGFTLVYYWSRSSRKDEAGPFCELILAGVDGKAERVHAELEGYDSRLSVYCVRTPRRLKFRTARGDFTIVLACAVDQSPFYERYLVEGVGPLGQRGSGFAEVVLPERVDRPWMRPFVRMRTHSLIRPNSLWLPLFSGGSGEPGARTFKSLFAGRRHV